MRESLVKIISHPYNKANTKSAEEISKVSSPLIKTDLDGIEQWSHIFEEYQLVAESQYCDACMLIPTSDDCYIILTNM